MNTEQLISHSRSRFDHVAAKKTLKEKYQAKLVFAHNGGMFKATPELIVFLKSCLPRSKIVLLDLYDNPVEADVAMLTDEAEQRYHEQMNAWLLEYEQLARKR